MRQNEAYTRTACVGPPFYRFPSSRVLPRAISTTRTPSHILIKYNFFCDLLLIFYSNGKVTTLPFHNNCNRLLLETL